MSATPVDVVNPSHSDDDQAGFPQPGVDHFAILGLEPRPDIARSDVERRYLERSRRWHPDRFAASSTATKRRAMEATTALNAAYRVVRDEVARLEYLCRMSGIDIDSSDPRRGAPAMDHDFLIDMIERREALDAARRAGESAVAAFRDRVEAELDEAFGTARENIIAGNVHDAARRLVVRRYLQRLIDEIDDHADG